VGVPIPLVFSHFFNALLFLFDFDYPVLLFTAKDKHDGIPPPSSRWSGCGHVFPL
jgi:hypothetical protein